MIIKTNCSGVTDDDCFCYSLGEVRKIAKDITAHKACRYELEQYQNLVTKTEQAPWYHDKNVIIGGVVISFGVGALVGWAVSR